MDINIMAGRITSVLWDYSFFVHQPQPQSSMICALDTVLLITHAQFPHMMKSGLGQILLQYCSM